MEKITRTDCVRNVVLQRVKEERNVLHTYTIQGRKSKWIGHILRRNFRVDRRKDRRDGNTRNRRKQLLDDLKKQRGCWKLEEEALELALEETMDLS